MYYLYSSYYLRISVSASLHRVCERHTATFPALLNSAATSGIMVRPTESPSEDHEGQANAGY